MNVLKISFYMLVVSIASYANAEDANKYANDWKSPESLVDAMYETISAEPGAARDWDRFRELFFDKAAFLVAIKTPDFSGILASDVNGLIQQTDSAYGKTGFHENEISRNVNVYGKLASVYSAYEIKLKKSDKSPLMKGLNHFQLLNDGDRWWIISNTSIVDSADYEASSAL